MPSDFYSTSDTALAAFLISSGQLLIQVDYTNPRFEFRFRDSVKLRELTVEYISGRALTEPITFNRVNRKLLRILRNQRQWEED